MTPRPKHTKPDANQAQIVADLRDLGAVVWILADLGGEVLDLMVFWRGLAIPVEVKRSGCEHIITDGEHESMVALEGVGIPYAIATCAEDVLRVFEELEEARGA